MAYFTNKKVSLELLDNELDPESLGAETEAEKQMKMILEKQLNTKLSMREQFSQHRTFVAPSTYKSLTELVQGTCSTDTFRELENDEEVNQELQRCGLSEDEISDYLVFKSGKNLGNRLINPSILQERILRIEDKIKAHNNELQKPQEFQNRKKLTRHQMDIEKTLYAGCAGKSKLAALVSTEEITHGNSSMEDAYSYIKDLSNRILTKCSNNRKKRKKRDIDLSEADTHEEDNGLLYDSNIHHVVVPLDEEEVTSKQLSIDEIKELPKFENYEMGVPNKTLYLKNLHIKTTTNELRSIFARFEEECGPAIDYRICTGRMKGQAFVKFQDAAAAVEALKFANGFILRGKPIIIEFGRKS